MKLCRGCITVVLLAVNLLIVNAANGQVDSLARARTLAMYIDVASGKLPDMKSLLGYMNSESRYPAYFFNNRTGVKYYEKIIATSANNDFNIYNLGLQYLFNGQTEKAIDIFTNLYERDNVSVSKQVLLQKLALSYFRLGEQQNCIKNHNEESCIMPFHDKAVHVNKNPALKAIELYTQLLTTNPKNFTAQWMLNVAYMAVGQYPAEVPRQYLIDLDLYCYESNIPKFVNIAPAIGVNTNTYYGGVSIDDFNNDDYPDIFVASGRTEVNVAYYVNNGDGTFTDNTKVAKLVGITGGCNLIHADYDGDGFIDLYIIRDGWLLQNEFPCYPNSLIKNNGDGTFTDVTFKSGLLEFNPSHTAAFADFDNDGCLDLFVGNESDSLRKHPSSLFRNNGDGTFTNVTELAKINVDVFVKGVAWNDVNSDGFPDLYISVFGGNNMLLLNKADTNTKTRYFENVAASWGVEKPYASFPLFFADINNDGLTDLFVDSYGIEENKGGVNLTAEYLGEAQSPNPPALYINSGKGYFENKTQEYGLNRTIYSMGLNVGDIDCDGFPDFYCGTGNPSYEALFPNLMFRNAGGKYFEDVTCNTHTGHLQKTHGIAFADLDLDGDQDMYVNIGGFLQGDIFENALFVNPGNDNNFVSIKLTGVQSNRSAIGVKIALRVSGPTGTRNIYRTVSTGGSYGSSPLQQHIGIGTADKIEQLIIYWPSTGIKQTFKNVAINKFYRISEDKNKLEKIKNKSFDLGEHIEHLPQPGEHQHHH